MGEKTDKAKGHVKEAVGDLTDNERLQLESGMGSERRSVGLEFGPVPCTQDKISYGVDEVRDWLHDDD